MSFHPLLAPRDPEAPIAWRGGEPVSARQFLADAALQAEALPAQGPVVNLCTDRYRFAVGLAAALMRGHASLFPPNAMAETLAGLKAAYPSLAALTDDGQPVPGDLKAIPPAGTARLAGCLPDMPALPQVEASQQAATLLTSGSTGTPQPHAKHWGTLVSNVGAAASRLAGLMGGTSLRGLNIVATVPAQHMYGFESSVLLALLGGAAFESARPFYPADIAAALSQVPRPRALVTTPFHLKMLLLSGVELPEVDLVLSATAPLSPQLAQQAEGRFGGVLAEIYGCTEAGQVATRRTAQTEVWHTFGELRVRAEGQGDEERFIVQGGHVAEPTPLADVLSLIDDAHFRLLGRANDLIHVAGKRTSLSHLNYHLNSIPGVEDGAFWLPQDVADGVVRTVAFVVAPSLSPQEVVAGLRARVEAVFLPRRVVHLQSLPREATGKLTDKALRALAQEHLR